VPSLEESNLESRRSNIITDPLGDSEFDLIHARALLAHVDGLTAVENMVTALRPGGRLIVADPDFGTAGMVYPPVKELGRYWDALARTMIGAGGDPYVGRKLPYPLKTAGLVEVRAESRIRLRWDDDKYSAAFKYIAPVLVAAGLLDSNDVAVIEAFAPSGGQLLLRAGHGHSDGTEATAPRTRLIDYLAHALAWWHPTSHGFPEQPHHGS
jgi:SAM-dependent methyltransferase